MLFRLALIGLFCSLAATAKKTPLRILALGDSITYGYDEPSGNSYRRAVECLLHHDGYPVEFIGSVKNGNWENNESDAFNLNTTDQILVHAKPELTRPISQPNAIFLHAGTVNFVVGVNVTNAACRLAHLIDFITEHNPTTLLAVAQLIPNANATVNSLIDQYNARIPGLVSSRVQAGRRIVLVPMDVVKADDLPDGTHPNAYGYHIMARHWHEAVVKADGDGILGPARGSFVDKGRSSLPVSGNCSVLD